LTLHLETLVRRIVIEVLNRLQPAPSTAVEASSPMGMFRAEARGSPAGSASEPMTAQTTFFRRESHPSLLQFQEDRVCELEAGKPCIRSGRCRNFGF